MYARMLNKSVTSSIVYFITSKRSKLSGKATDFENNPKAGVCYFSGGDSVTLIGNVGFTTDRATQESLWSESDRRFFPKRLNAPKFRPLKFHTKETTFRIEGKL